MIPAQAAQRGVCNPVEHRPVLGAQARRVRQHLPARAAAAARAHERAVVLSPSDDAPVGRNHGRAVGLQPADRRAVLRQLEVSKRVGGSSALGRPKGERLRPRHAPEPLLTACSGGGGGTAPVCAADGTSMTTGGCRCDGKV